MRIGVLCEGEYTDQPMLDLLLRHLFPGIKFDVKGVTKRVIFENGDLELADMFASGVDRALIVWDLLPVGEQMGIPVQASRRPSRREQREHMVGLLCRSSYLGGPLLQQAQYFAGRYGFTFEGVPSSAHPNGGDDLYRLVCVCYALDGWLLSDQSVLCELASTSTRPLRRLSPAPGEPDRTENPAGALQRAFASAPSKQYRYYNKRTHNIRIAKAYIDQDRVDAMRASESFQRVAESIAAWEDQ